MKNKNLNIINKLEVLGFTQLEAKVYLYILEHNICKASAVYKDLNLDKSSTYRIVEELVDAGLVSKIGEKYGQELMVNNPDNLFDLVREKQDELEVASNTISDLIDDLSENAAQKYKDYNISVFEGREGYYKAMEKRLDSGSKMIYEISGDYQYPTDYWDYIPDFIARRVKKKIFLKSLVSQSVKNRKYEQSDDKLLKEVRLLPLRFQNKTLISIVGDYTSIANMESGRRLTVIIKDEMISQVMKSMFDVIWQSASKN